MDNKHIKNLYDFDISESSNNRIHNWITTQWCAMMSASRGNFSFKENLKRSHELKAVLMRKNYGVTQVKGIYVENYLKPNSKEVLEHSFLIVNLNGDPEFKNFIIELGKKYDQDSVLIIPMGGKGAYLYGTNESGYPGLNQIEDVGDFKSKDSGEFYSFKPGGIRFAFKKQEPVSSASPEWIVVKETEMLKDYSNFGKMSIALKADPIILEIDKYILKNKYHK